MAPKALNKSRLRQTLDHENRKAQLSERVHVAWGPAKLRSLVCDGDPMFQQHADLLSARANERVKRNKLPQRTKPLVQKTRAYRQISAEWDLPRPTSAAERGEHEYCYRLHSDWGLLDSLHAQLDHLDAHERHRRLRLLQATQRGWLDKQVAAKDLPLQEAQREKVLEAEEMERALAKFIECEKEKEEQRRCKGEKLKIDRECQVKESQMRRQQAKQAQLQEDLDQAAAEQRKDEAKEKQLQARRRQQRESMLLDVSNNQASIRAKKELIAKERQQDREQLIEYDSMLAARAAASEAALAAIRSRSAARCAAVGDWISKQEKERLEKEEAAVIKWQEQQEAKQAAYIAAAIARQQKTQAALEQAWAKQRQMKLDRKQSILQDEATYMAHLASCAAIRAKLQEAQAAAAHHKRRLLREAQELQDAYNRTRYLQESWMTPDERKINAFKLRQAAPLRAVVPASHKCFLPAALKKSAL
ncbi:hypothetical protein WJX84_009631 [Apatococcus fuscideae]|uniref:Trichohyalin-plectin-homology domain-containing protein n=1 Tax=Apatococcus fuscideae TaxID=2026836 RepID=A0AAW1TES2_9CHLO